MADTAGWFALVDTAQDSGLYPLVKQSRTHDCLFSGDVPTVLAAASPHLVAVNQNEPLMQAWLKHGRGKNWGILCESGAGFDTLRRHFKKFLNAQLPDGTVALFRFYDPRIFNTYIRSCTAEERAPWFAGVTRYSVEGADGAIHEYRLRDGRLYDSGTVVG